MHDVTKYEIGQINNAILLLFTQSGIKYTPFCTGYQSLLDNLRKQIRSNQANKRVVHMEARYHHNV